MASFGSAETEAESSGESSDESLTSGLTSAETSGELSGSGSEQGSALTVLSESSGGTDSLRWTIGMTLTTTIQAANRMTARERTMEMTRKGEVLV